MLVIFVLFFEQQKISSNHSVRLTMKVKEISRTANIAWSPAEQYPIYVAAGTAAQQLDATFSTSAALEIYALDLADPSVDMQLKSTLNTEHRYQDGQISCAEAN